MLLPDGAVDECLAGGSRVVGVARLRPTDTVQHKVGVGLSGISVRRKVDRSRLCSLVIMGPRGWSLCAIASYNGAELFAGTSIRESWRRFAKWESDANTEQSFEK